MPPDMGAMSAALYFQFFSGWSTRAFEEAFALLFRREVEEELDDAGAMAPEMALQIQDRTVAVMSEAVEQFSCALLALESIDLSGHRYHLG